jgi:hypothetical protein
MTDATPVHDYLLPRLAELVRGAAAQGMEKDVVVAVLIDLVASPLFDTATADPMGDSAPHPDWDRSHPDIVMVTQDVAANVNTIGVHAEDDFIAPLTIHD